MRRKTANVKRTNRTVISHLAGGAWSCRFHGPLAILHKGNCRAIPDEFCSLGAMYLKSWEIDLCVIAVAKIFGANCNAALMNIAT
jgi:hypothetical protein